MTATLHDWLRLSLAPGLGAVSLARLHRHFGSASTILAADKAALEQAGVGAAAIRYLRSEQFPEPARRAEEWSAQPGQGALDLDDPAYPARLREIADPPPVLFYRGDPDLLALPALAMVGSRNPTAGGADTAFEFARHLAGVGLCIASGLALGVDAASHRGALAAGGLTLAVMGTGPDRIYPARHRGLGHEILEAGGLVVSELLPGTDVQASNFPRRNRILSALAVGTLVVEAGLRSGSLITARHALDQGREVFAIPGSIHNPLARGCHALIRQGAKLVETAADVLEELAPVLRLASGTFTPAGNDPLQAPEPPADADHQRLLECLGHDPVSIDRLVQRSGFKAAEVASMLLILELQGQVAPLPGGRYQRRG